jgi:DNA recombination protein RmuC
MNDEIQTALAWLRGDPLMALALFGGVALLAFLTLIILTIRHGALLSREEQARAESARASESELAELRGRVSQMAENTALRQEELSRAVNERLDRVSQHLGASIEETGRRSSDWLTQMMEIAAARQGELARAMDERLDRVSRHLGAGMEDANRRTAEGLAQMVNASAQRQEVFIRAVNERLDRVSQNLGASVEETGHRTSDNLARLAERLAVIDDAQRNIAELSGRVVSLQDILANKQARGAFGQMRMEAIVEDGLPKGAYSFQPTLSNGRRPDCLIQLSASRAQLVVDAKFPLEAFEALRAAADESARGQAQARVRRDVGRHIEDIAAKYFIPGETQDTALMFVPAESIYAELHDGFPDLIQKAHRERVVIVSPNMLMLAVQTMMAILKDVRTREQAGVIQREVGLLVGDVAQLAERVGEFQRRFGQLGPELDKIAAAAGRIAERGRRIEALEVEEGKDTGKPLIAAAE